MLSGVALQRRPGSAVMLRHRCNWTGSPSRGGHVTADDVTSCGRSGETTARTGASGGRLRQPSIYPTPTRSSELRQLLHSRDRFDNSSIAAAAADAARGTIVNKQRITSQRIAG